MNKIRELIYSIDISLSVQEGILEGLRLAFWTGISALVTYLLDKAVTFPNPELWTLVLTVVLRSLEKVKYTQNKFESRGRNTNGLTF
jgi:SpoU rRNA methylase family enzyme